MMSVRYLDASIIDSIFGTKSLTNTFDCSGVKIASPCFTVANASSPLSNAILFNFETIPPLAKP